MLNETSNWLLYFRNLMFDVTPKFNYFQIYIASSDKFSLAWNPLFIFRNIDASSCIVNISFLNFRLALLWFCWLLIVLRALIHLINIGYNFWQVFSFLLSFFSISNNNFLFLKKCFPIVTTNDQMPLKVLEWSTTITDLWWFWSILYKVNSPSSYLFILYFSELFILQIKTIHKCVHKFIAILIISQQMLVQLFFINRIINIL